MAFSLRMGTPNLAIPALAGPAGCRPDEGTRYRSVTYL